MKKEEKTNVMRVLDGKKISYQSHSYEPDATMSGEEIAAILGEDPDNVFKTLVTQGKTGAYYVFVVPVRAELDLKKNFTGEPGYRRSLETIKIIERNGIGQMKIVDVTPRHVDLFLSSITLSFKFCVSIV